MNSIFKNNIKRAFIIFLNVLIFFNSLKALAQNQNMADSLIEILNSNELVAKDRLDLLKAISEKTTDPSEKIQYSNILIDAAKDFNSPFYIQSGLLTLGSAYIHLGQIDKALDVLFEGAKIARDNNFNKEVGTFYGQISIAYAKNNDSRNALNFKIKALNVFEIEQDSMYIGLASLNIGYEYYKLRKLDSATIFYVKAGDIFKKLNHEVASAYVTGNKALVFWKKGELTKAKNQLNKAIKILNNYKDNYAVADYLNNLGRIYYEEGDIKNAINTTIRSIELAKQVDLKEQIRDASLLLSELYEKRLDSENSLKYHKQYVDLKDSIQSIETTQKMADLRTEFEVGQKQAEVDLLTAEKRTQRIITIAIGAFAFILVVLAAIIYKYYRSKAKINKILADQKTELERLNSTKDKFFSIISHDLRSPVAGFHGISQMIKMMVQSKQTDQLLEMTEHIDESVDQLSKLLDNLLNWAMQQQGHIPNVPEKLNLKEMADELLKVLSNMAQGKSIELIADVPAEMELWSDKNTTMTILRNLVNNALKFTPEGGEVGIKASEESGLAKIEVYDTGVGMPEDKLKKLFQLQDKKSTYGTSGEKGLGLGLQLVHEFMEMNNGKIEVDSEEGKGTTFTLWLPLFESVGEAVEK